MTYELEFSPELPWTLDESEVQRLKRIVSGALVFFIGLALVVGLVKLPPPDRAQTEKVPEWLAKVIVAPKETPLTPEPLPEPLVKKPTETLPQQAQSGPDTGSEAPLRQAQSPRATGQRPVPGAVDSGPTSEQISAARDVASRSGILVMKDQLAALRSLGGSSLSQSQTSVGTEGTERRVETDLIAQTATSGSGGVAAKGITHAGGGKLAGHTATQIRGPGGSGIGGGGGTSLAEINKEAKSGKRSTEDIKLGFDANKSALYAVYRRALRENPTLEGRVVLKLTVDPSGQVTACSIVSSALKDPALEEKLVQRVQLINFGARPGVAVWTGNYDIDFVPTS